MRSDFAATRPARQRRVAGVAARTAAAGGTNRDSDTDTDTLSAPLNERDAVAA